MADTDRRTGIDGDQISDHTITPSEIKTVNDVADPNRWQVLAWDKTLQKMKWIYNFGNQILK